MPVPLGTGATGKMHGIIESSQLPPSSSFQSEFRLFNKLSFLFFFFLAHLAPYAISPGTLDGLVH